MDECKHEHVQYRVCRDAITLRMECYVCGKVLAEKRTRSRVTRPAIMPIEMAKTSEPSTFKVDTVSW